MSETKWSMTNEWCNLPAMPSAQSPKSGIYLGEPSERHLIKAVLLSVLLPGLGHVYAGKPLRAMIIFGCWMLGLAMGLCTFLFMDVFLLKSFMGIVVFWLTLTLWIGADLINFCSRAGRTYILKPYNSYLVYGFLFVILGCLPLWSTAEIFTSTLFGIHEVSSDENFPSLRTGDRVLYRKSAEANREPNRGDVVLAELRDGSLSALRVMAGPKDKIRVRANGRVSLNQVLLSRQPLGRVQWKTNELNTNPIDLVGFVEVLGKTTYEVFLNPEVRMYGESTEELGDNMFFLLADNRTTHRALDSRHLGPFPKSRILGEAMYVLYGVHPRTGNYNWERTGLKVQ